MGMYTELVLGIKIKPDPDVLTVLNYMLGETDHLDERPSHELFKTNCWDIMLVCDSYYFDGQTDSKLFKDDLYPESPMYYLNVRSNLKNYNSEIEKFLDWLKPYIETDGFLGYTRYEEDDHPTLIYKDNRYNTIDYLGVDELIKQRFDWI